MLTGNNTAGLRVKYVFQHALNTCFRRPLVIDQIVITNFAIVQNIRPIAYA
jgi:hypothetical protein